MTDFIEADHYSKVDPGLWPWRSFSPQEIACRGTGKIRISKDAMTKLQKLRDAMGCPLIINSAYRSPEHNRAIGGARNSYHTQGVAFDVSMTNHDPDVFAAKADLAGFTGFGFYPPKQGGFIHIDTGPRRTWGKRWKAPRFDAEPKAQTGKKAFGVLSLATVGTGAVEAVSPENLKAVQETVTPMIAYAPIFQAVFAAAGFGIVGWMVWNRFIKKAP